MEHRASMDAKGVPPREEQHNIPTPHDVNDAPPREEQHNIPTPQEVNDVPPRQEHSNFPTPQEVNDVPPRQEHGNIPTPQEVNDVPPRQEHSSIPTPQEINDVPPIQRQTGSSIVPTQDPNNGPPWQQQANIELPPDPPLNWRLNVLLEDIASNIDAKELDRIKILFRGPNGLSKSTLEKCNTFVKLFDVLRERCFLLRGNLVYLNKILYTLNRQDLIEKVVKYCREEGNVVHYYKEDYVEPGYTSSKFHVPVDIKKINTTKIDGIRNSVAKIVCAPVELVLIVAVEPGSSLLVTLKLPTMYSQILQHLLETKHDLWELTAVGIDTVFVNDKTYNLTEIHGADVVETEQQRKIMNIYEQLEQTKQALERSEIQAIARSNEIQELRHLLSNSNKMQTSEETHERKNMERLAACPFVRNENRAGRKRKAAWGQERLKYDDIHYQLETGSVSAAQALRLMYALSLYTRDVSIAFYEIRWKTAYEVGQLLTEKEIQRLMERYHLEDNDVIKTCVERNKRLFLAGVLTHEMWRVNKKLRGHLFYVN